MAQMEHFKEANRYNTSHQKELYNSSKVQFDRECSQQDSSTGTKLNGMFSNVRLRSNNTLGEAQDHTDALRTGLKTSLLAKRNLVYLSQRYLPPVPKTRSGMRIIISGLSKKVTKKVGKDTHFTLTNGGYSRTSYGGFYLHQPSLFDLSLIHI
eukprot:TRINITY_DN64980_c0_g1_i1.p1 TRINITY_DN64980_c0_g1~~TRINITY_DN64980_c0_g1_i1.p1  ORF type:complete len:153 (-),score=9.23 TRINITY_DN64980_c0_g1_i1:134-592(-)